MNKLIKIVLFCLVTKSFLAGAYEEVDGITANCNQACQDFHQRQYELYKLQLDMLLMEQRAQNDVTNANSVYQPPEAPVDESMNDDAVTEDENQEESQEETRQDCLEKVELSNAICEVNASKSSIERYESLCEGGLQFEGSIGAEHMGVGINGGVSYDDYTQCKDSNDMSYDNALKVCSVFKSQAIIACPSQ